MANLPMWGPDPVKPGPSSSSSGIWIPPDELLADIVPKPESDLAELAAKFAAQSGGGLSQELSADLALEIVLNEIVEQACLATGATGAAIVLQRDGEFVCRASAGANAPELGVRLDRESGLSGACIRTCQLQRCDDAQADPRADMEASRWLGVRSVMILPMLRNDDLLGVFEVFSSRPSAFQERDLRTLKALAQCALKNLIRAREPILETAVETTAETTAETKTETTTEPVQGNAMEVPAPMAEPEPVEETGAAGIDTIDSYAGEVARSGHRIDPVAFALAVAVFACAILLSTLFGLHMSWKRAASANEHKVRVANRRISNVKTENPTNTTVPASPLPTEASATRPATASAVASTSPLSASDASGAKKTSVANAQSGSRAAAPPAGSLLVYENGKEIFRMLPSTTAGENAKRGDIQQASSLEPAPAVELPPEAAENDLLRRVEPEYPEQARQQRIQGPVILDLRIGKDGAVEEVTLVSGPAVLAEAATFATRQWRFRPHLVGGQPVEMQTRVTLRFTLPQE
jgi:TonB family protein